MNPVIVRNVKIGEGMPKICVPVMGVNKAEIIEAAKCVSAVPADIVEWRADWFRDIFNLEKVIEVAGELRDILGDTPVLFTFRTAKEGGEQEIATEMYVELNQMLAKSGYVDMIDVEAFTGNEEVREIIDTAHACGVKVVASNHDFYKTPPKEELISSLCKMQELGADVPKIAVMPQSRRDVLTLLAATEEMVREYADRPIITMSMNGEGVISRLCGEVFGSAVTFGAAGRTSAPGQMQVKELKMVLEMLHGKLGTGVF